MLMLLMMVLLMLSLLDVLISVDYGDTVDDDDVTDVVVSLMWVDDGVVDVDVIVVDDVGWLVVFGVIAVVVDDDVVCSCGVVVDDNVVVARNVCDV